LARIFFQLMIESLKSSVGVSWEKASGNWEAAFGGAVGLPADHHHAFRGLGNDGTAADTVAVWAQATDFIAKLSGLAGKIAVQLSKGKGRYFLIRLYALQYSSDDLIGGLFM
jgi:hypothetical protein